MLAVVKETWTEQQADRLRRRRLLRGVARRGRGARPGEPRARRRTRCRGSSSRRRSRCSRATTCSPSASWSRATRSSLEQYVDQAQHRGRDRRLDRAHDAPARGGPLARRRSRRPASRRLVDETAGLVDEFVEAIFALEERQRDETTPRTTDGLDGAKYMRDTVIPAMAAVREVADKLERIVPDDLWPLPKYSEMLFIK